ncbi:helix-turn-helix transcriptional regulator [Saccharothrix sp. ALI-22-I]|uniref:LuxR C-terminal-related transcriptional regulator n=1 Tax=Saccharothrix sp. ALI-22-I TaxID=1933778 RepID=UPI00097C86F7|nr:LuxR C-terminal-related transcriptional regulator [Saccharothrix sp. ALI-22-I]ONI90027.1 helix-turn-helix transcriptional regulator [Saccharothrix sp. ALI-22-I]
MGSVPDLERGRRLYAQARWREAYDALTLADVVTRLPASDLELLGRAAYMLGRDDDYVNALERAHHAHLDDGAPMPAVRCAFWIGHSRLFRGQTAPASGWFARAERLLDQERGDVAERGYVLVGALLGHLVRGDAAGALAVAAEITAIGERFGDPDLVAIGRMEQGHALVRTGHADDGLRLIDETMVAVTSGELSPIVTGIVYCNTISFCRGVYQLRRVREWTAALTRWCARQPQMVTHNGLCLVHRAEIMTLGGAWDDALDELHRVGEEFTLGALNRLASGEAAYRYGEVRRLQGRFELAEDAYRRASALGREPQPGLALTRLAQGSADSAAATIRRAVSESTRGLPRVDLLPAYVRIMLAVGDVDAAAVACRELDEIAAQQRSEAIDAMRWHARSALALAEGDAQAALAACRRACEAWRQLDAPYEAARSRVLLGRACRLLGDEDSAGLELRAARQVFTELGAQPEVLELLEPSVDAERRHGLSPREQEVLRLVASGQSNRQIAATLVLSEHTVARHLQNIFAKLDVSSRTAASAFAYEHHLV